MYTDLPKPGWGSGDTKAKLVVLDQHVQINPLTGRLKTHSNRPLYSNPLQLVHWPLVDGLLHLVQRGGAWAGCGPGPPVSSSLYQM